MGISDFVAKQFVDVIDWTEPLREALALCSPIDFVLSVRKSSADTKN